MTRLTPEAYLDHIRAESARFRAVLSDCDPSARVPSCPDWDAGDLLWHLVTVQWFWSTAVSGRPSEVDISAEPTRPATHDETLQAFDTWSAALSSALEGLDPAEPAWTWSSDPADHTVGFILRRQAHEALIHRLDAELAAGVESGVDARLAADGVAEVVAVMYGGLPPWGSWEPLPHHVRLDCTDTGDEVWAQLGLFSGTHPGTGETFSDEDDCHLVDPPADVEPDVVIDGPAAALDAWLWHRGGDEDLSVAGDRAILDRFRAVIAQPID
jgi:uncharacterized protein (TIGR03083 family)